MNKKILFFSILFFFLAFAPQVFAQGFTALAPIPGLTDKSIIDSVGFANFFNNLYKYVIGLAAVLAVIMIIWGGLEISTQDSISKQGAGRERITQAIYGLILVLLPVLVFTIINPSILKLSLNLTEIDLKHAQYLPTTQLVTLSAAKIDERQLSGGTVLYAFKLVNQQNSTAIHVRNILNGKQSECTVATGGPGIILPEKASGGGMYNYVCQTCPPNTTMKVRLICSLKDLTCGFCQVNSGTSQQTTETTQPGTDEDFYPSPQAGMFCLGLKDTSKGASYCAKSLAACTSAFNGLGGTAAVTSSCTSY